MFSIYQLYCMNNMKLPFKIKRSTWGNTNITVDRVDNFHFSAKDWRCDAYTLSSDYDAPLDEKTGVKLISCGGNYSWSFTEKDHDPDLIKPYREYNRPKSEKGLTVQNAGKTYSCRHCKRTIEKGTSYEKYSVRSAGKLGAIKEAFCIGCRDKLREVHFGKRAEEVNFSEILAAWGKGVLV